MSDWSAHVAAYLREADRERYLATLFVPVAQRADVQALLAFATEIAGIPARVREPSAGEIRLQWWIDAIEGDGHGDVRQNPTAAALLDVLERHELPAGPLIRLLRARRFDLYQDPMPDLASFEGYAGETESVLFQLSALIVGGGETLPGDAAGYLGVARALTGHLRAFGYHASRGRLFLPQSIMAANGVDEQDVLSGRETPQIMAALEQVGDLAHERLAAADAAIRQLPQQVRPVFTLSALPAAQIRLYRRAATPFAAPPDLADWRKLARMAWWSLRA